MQIRLLSFRLTFTRSKALVQWRDKRVVIVSIVRLVYYAVVDNYKPDRDRIYHKHWFRRTSGASGLGLTRCSRVAYRWTTAYIWGVVWRRSAPSNNTLTCKYVEDGTSWWEVWGIERNRRWPRTRGPSVPFMGVVSTLIDHAHQLFTYQNISLIRTKLRMLLARWVRITEDLL